MLVFVQVFSFLANRRARGETQTWCASCWSTALTATSFPNTRTRPCILPSWATICSCTTSWRTTWACECGQTLLSTCHTVKQAAGTAAHLDHFAHLPECFSYSDCPASWRKLSEPTSSPVWCCWSPSSLSRATGCARDPTFPWSSDSSHSHKLKVNGRNSSLCCFET